MYYKSTEEVYEFSEEEVSDRHSYIKKLNVDVVWKNEQENTENVLSILEGAPDAYVLFLKKSEYDENGGFVRLNNGSTGSFYFTGTLNANPELVWEDGEVTVSFGYEIENVEENLEKTEQEEQGRQEEELSGMADADGDEGKKNQADADEEERKKNQSDADRGNGRQNQPDAGGEEAHQNQPDADGEEAHQNQPDAGREEAYQNQPDAGGEELSESTDANTKAAKEEDKQ